jgi:hypothetical protein
LGHKTEKNVITEINMFLYGFLLGGVVARWVRRPGEEERSDMQEWLEKKSEERE